MNLTDTQPGATPVEAVHDTLQTLEREIGG